MATSFAPLSISSVGGSHVKSREVFSTKRNSTVFGPKLAVQRKSNIVSRRNLISPVRAEHRDNRGGGGGDLVASFLLGGAIFGSLAYVFAPQIRRYLLDENEHGFRIARKPIYIDEDLERSLIMNERIDQLNSAVDNISSRLISNNNVKTLNEKISQLNSAIDNISSRLISNNNVKTLNEKIGQLNSAIDNIYSRLRGNNDVPTAAPLESDPEVEATM